MRSPTKRDSKRNKEVFIPETIKPFHHHAMEAGMSSSNMGQSIIELRASSSKHILDISSQQCSREVEENKLLAKQLAERLRFLEEETASLKAAFWETMEERTRLMTDLYKEMQAIHNYLQLRDHERGHKVSNQVSIFKSAEDGHAGLMQVLSQDSNPLLVVRNVRARDPAKEEERPIQCQSFSRYKG